MGMMTCLHTALLTLATACVPAFAGPADDLAAEHCSGRSGDFDACVAQQLAAINATPILGDTSAQRLQVDQDEAACLNAPNFVECVRTKRYMRTQKELYAKEKAARDALWQRFLDLPPSAKCLDRKGRDFEPCLARVLALFPPDFAPEVGREIRAQRDQRRQEDEDRAEALAGERAARDCAAQRRQAGTAWIGMTWRQAMYCGWGRPQHVNRTTTASRVSEQWVYPNGSYLYFDNGLLTAIQN